MADPHIDQYETLAYGRFAVAQILGLVVGLDAPMDDFIKLVAQRLDDETETMSTTLTKVGALDAVTYTAADSVTILAESRGVLKRFVSYAESRTNGDTIVRDALQGDNLSTVLRRRPVKIAAALELALTMIDKHKASLPEHAQWTADMTAAHTALAGLNGSVRKARTDRRSMTPEVATARSNWLVRYASSKLLIEGILKPLGKTSMMPEIFDDLAEVHRASGVSDDDAPAEAKTPPGP
jgi:hypothetical protein